MDDAARARSAAREAIADITPPPLADLLDARLCDSAMVAGVLTCLAARAAKSRFEPQDIDRRSAGVQLIHEGLTLTRSLARDPGWERDGSGDLEVLAADVLVARGFYLLARTEAAPKAVETVRSFGRDEARREDGESIPDGALEADIFELAIIAGMATMGTEVPGDTRGFAVDLARSLNGGPQRPELLSEPAVETLADLAADGGQRSAAPERIWAGSSTTDP